jgi:phage FluMu gp28-like protein
VVAARAVHTAIYEPESLILLVSENETKSGELLRKILTVQERLEGVPKLLNTSALKLEWENRSRCIALPGSPSAPRSFSAPSLVLLDEAAFVRDELLDSITPTMATRPDATFIALSTFNGTRGWFFESWEHGEGWEKIRVTCDECPRIPKDFLDRELREKGQSVFDEEYRAIPRDPKTAVFNAELIERAITNDLAPLFALAA